MAITTNSGRQEVIHTDPLTIAYSDITSDTGASEAVFNLPIGAIVVGGGVHVDTVFDSTTSDVLDVGDGGDPNRYTVSQIDLQTAGPTLFDITGYEYTAADAVDLQWTAGTTSTATQGSFKIWLSYIVADKYTSSQT